MLLKANGDDSSLQDAVEVSCGWGSLETLVAKTGQLTETVKADPLEHIIKGYHRFRLYAQRMLKALKISGATAVRALLDATAVIRDGLDIAAGAVSFLRPRSNWRKHLRSRQAGKGFGSLPCCSICAMRSGPEISG